MTYPIAINPSGQSPGGWDFPSGRPWGPCHGQPHFRTEASSIGKSSEQESDNQPSAETDRGVDRPPRGARGHSRGRGFQPDPENLDPGTVESMFEPGGGRPRRRRGGRRNRGAVRAAVLLLLDEKPRHGYEILTELAARSNGAWRPSPGSIYPILKSLSEEGLVQPDQQDGRRTFHLTDEGRELVRSRRDSWGEPWSNGSAHAQPVPSKLEKEAQQLADAVRQVVQVGDEHQVNTATKVLSHARRSIYLMLAGERPPIADLDGEASSRTDPDPRGTTTSRKPDTRH